MNLRIILLSLFLFLTSILAQASSGTDVGIFFGVKNAEMDVDVSGVKTNSTTGLMGGVMAYGEMGGLMMRTGGYYSERSAELKASTLKADLKVSYIDVPVTLMYSFNDMLSLFGGAVLGLKVSDKCSGDASFCSGSNEVKPKSFLPSATLGLNAKFHPNWSGEIFYEHGLSDLANDTKVSAISIGLVFIY